MEYRLQSMYNHMVGRTASVISPFYSLLPDVSSHAKINESFAKYLLNTIKAKNKC